MDVCKLCSRKLPLEYITEHHLEPENRKNSDTVNLCQPCHDQVHAVFTNNELKNSYNSIDALKESDRLQDYIDWISKTKKVDINVNESNSVNEWRSDR